MKLGWLSDIHLDFLGSDPSATRPFVTGLRAHEADAWLLTGDIATARSVTDHLRLFDEILPVTTYFTLGNHDYYRGSLTEVGQAVRRLVSDLDRLVWLNLVGPQVVADRVAVVGDDGWGDARIGNALTTPVQLNDFHLIADLRGLARGDLVRTLNRLGDEAAARLAPKLAQAAGACERVIVLTHVPPYREAAWHEGRHSDDDWAPWFTCRAVGDVIDACARMHPATSFLVLCGHTHGEGTYAPLDNVVVHTAAADYGAPRVQRVFKV